MTTYEKPPEQPERRNGHRSKKSLAYWAALTAFFSNLVALKVVGLLVSDDNIKIGIGALATSAIVAGGVYTKQRLDEAKAREQRALPPM